MISVTDPSLKTLEELFSYVSPTNTNVSKCLNEDLPDELIPEERYKLLTSEFYKRFPEVKPNIQGIIYYKPDRNKYKTFVENLVMSRSFIDLAMFLYLLEEEVTQEVLDFIVSASIRCGMINMVCYIIDPESPICINYRKEAVSMHTSRAIQSSELALLISFCKRNGIDTTDLVKKLKKKLTLITSIKKEDIS